MYSRLELKENNHGMLHRWRRVESSAVEVVKRRERHPSSLEYVFISNPQAD